MPLHKTREARRSAFLRGFNITLLSTDLLPGDARPSVRRRFARSEEKPHKVSRHVIFGDGEPNGAH